MTDKHERIPFDIVFVESVVEELNEMLMEKYADEETMPVLGIVRKDDLPGDVGVWVHLFKTADVKAKLDKE